MDAEIKELLDEAIKEEIRGLSTFESGSNKKSSAIDDLAKLYKLRIEETKNELDFEEKREKRFMDNDECTLKVNMESINYERDEQLKKEQLAEQVKERYFRLGIATAEIVLPLIFYAVWMKKGFKFEETGTYTSSTFRGLFNRFKPTKK